MGKIENSALFKISYGLYALTCNDGVRHGGLIVNTVLQQTSTPLILSVTISKQNYSHDVIKSTKKLTNKGSWYGEVTHVSGEGNYYFGILSNYGDSLYFLTKFLILSYILSVS